MILARTAWGRRMGACLAMALALGSASARPVSPPPSPEARLIAIYHLVEEGRAREALDQAESLTRDVPNFQLAQLVYGDLLLVRQGRFAGPGDVPSGMAANKDQWVQLRREAALRLAALSERPPANALPREFVDLPASSRHAIAVDASRSRLYLFENSPQGLRLVAHHYVSMGRSGVGKRVQGDQRTPLGVYFITSRLDAAQLQDFYGAGALTLNYPNEFDRREGRTGHGIWLHGVPSQNFARSPQSTDGCVVLANADMRQLLRDVSPRSTPVVITQSIQWVQAPQAEAARQAARELMGRWNEARASGDARRLLAFYSPRFASGSMGADEWARVVERDVRQAQGRPADLKDMSILSWRESADVMVVTFGLVPRGQRTGVVKRQYWGKEGGQWKIFFEGVIG